MSEMCPECHGLGYIIVCCDDLCANSERCIHGDGEEPCDYCEGSGVIFDDADDDGVWNDDYDDSTKGGDAQ